MKKNQEEKIEEITPAIKAKLDEFAEMGNQLEEEEQYEEAIQPWASVSFANNRDFENLYSQLWVAKKNFNVGGKLYCHFV